MLGVVETPLKNVLMNVDTSSAEEAVGSASQWSGSISGPACGQICRMGKMIGQKESIPSYYLVLCSSQHSCTDAKPHNATDSSY